VVDMAEFCKQIFDVTTGDYGATGGLDRQQSCLYFTNTFQPGHDFDIACRTDTN